jgi:hypothetical protein
MGIDWVLQWEGAEGCPETAVIPLNAISYLLPANGGKAVEITGVNGETAVIPVPYWEIMDGMPDIVRGRLREWASKN